MRKISLKEIQTFDPDINFKLKFKNRITDEEYFQLNQGATAYFTDEEQTKLSLVFKDYRKSYQHIYGFKYSKRTFGEPSIEFYGFITKFRSYYLLDLKYKISLPHAKGRDDCFGLFYNFDDLLKFLTKLIELDIPKE